MAELNPPWALENLATHHANVNRMMMSALVGRAEGVAYGMAVTQRGAGANMSVDVSAGVGVVFGDENVAQGAYGVTNDATTNVVVTTASGSIIRFDLVVARVRDTVYSGGTNAWALEIVPGVSASTDPVVPNNALVLARITVAINATQITTANITDLRPFLFNSGGILPVNSARPPGVLYGPYSQEAASGFRPAPDNGLHIYERDTEIVKYYNGTLWKATGDHIPHIGLTHTIMTGDRTTASGSYGAIPTDTCQVVGFVKYRADTTLMCEVSANNWYTSVVATVSFGAQVNGVDYDCSSQDSDGGRRSSFGFNKVTGLAAGTYTITVRWKTTAGTAHLDTNGSRAMLKVTETL